MSVGHYTKPYSFDPCECSMCHDQATVYVMAKRESRSGNLREFTMGPYCDACAKLAIESSEQRERRKAETADE